MTTEPTAATEPTEPTGPTEPTSQPDSPPAPARAPRRFGLGALVLVALLGASVATAVMLLIGHPGRSGSVGTGGGSGSTAHVEEAAPLYQCPMHPSIVQDHPGDCPICGMKLVKVDPAKAKAKAGGQGGAPAREAKVAPVSGLATVDIDPARQQLIGLTTAEVTHGPVGGAWRTAGRVAVDETRVRHVNLKVGGFVEKIFVDFVGKQVRTGDPLFSVYSPDLLSAQEEYLLALKTKGALGKPGGAIASDGDALVAAARRKLALWDVPEAEIDRIASTGEPTKAVTFYSPVAGVVTKKDAVQGMKLDAGAMPYEIVDLSSVWVLADVYESELRFVKEGMGASLKLNAFPNREFKGRVVFLNPLLDPQTRTVKVRLTFPNPTGELRPEMFGEVVLLGEPHDGLRIPADAVIDSGTQKVVFVALGEGKFQPRTVKLGDSDSAHVEVLTGVALGEHVVTRANFLIDSESRLRASLAEMAAGAAPPEHAPESARVLPGATAPPAHQGHAP